MQNNKPLEEAVVEVRLPALSKQAAQVISDIDKFLDYFQKARGTLPQRILLRQRHWHQIRRSMERAAREAKAPVRVAGLTYRGLPLVLHGGIERGETA